jgi:transposase
MLGALRKEVWQRFGSINGSGIDFRALRNEWVKTRDFSPLPAKAWKETLRDVLDDIAMYEEAAKLKVRQDIAKKTSDKAERARLYKALKGTEWKNDPYLSRKMRQYRRHGQTDVKNQIILECGVYSQFRGKDGRTWFKVPTFTRGSKLAIPLNSNILLKGCLRLILKDGQVFVHYTIEQKIFAPCGDRIIGVDKGYTEAIADSEGCFHGKDLGRILTEGTEKRHRRGKARNKLYQIVKKKPHKARNIYRYNRGRIKLTKEYDHQKELIRNIAFKAAHSVVDKARAVRCEDLTKPFASKQKWKKYNRTMSGWAKGSLADALNSVTKARGSCLRVVNAAYTSQMDSKTRRLEGRRVGDKFYHANGEVSHADTNAAVNIRERADDTEIGLFMSHRDVKKILLDRLAATGGVRAEPDRPSRTPVARRKRTSTESEIPNSM